MHHVIRLLLTGTCAALLAACGNAALTDAQRTAVTALQKELPTPYRDGLVTDSVHRHGADLVLMIRFPEATVAMAKAKPDLFNALRMDEQGAMTELCAYKVLAPVFAAGGGVRRRFVDADGKLFFETTLAAADCSPP